ncbi:hypothetical protein QR680_014192 [Steinernema hermaphroditum]|uniref:Uncharacterized protein n=1 Tax=Steinernema hermaphroditum TaxID=289476 RepID=A0AA39I805_9BILA|nr:hypothetical protein QR680_014192 [Steinernema hermaphroditum]
MGSSVTARLNLDVPLFFLYVELRRKTPNVDIAYELITKWSDVDEQTKLPSKKVIQISLFAEGFGKLIILPFDDVLRHSLQDHSEWLDQIIGEVERTDEEYFNRCVERCKTGVPARPRPAPGPPIRNVLASPNMEPMEDQMRKSVLCGEEEYVAMLNDVDTQREKRKMRFFKLQHPRFAERSLIVCFTHGLAADGFEVVEYEDMPKKKVFKVSTNCRLYTL